MFVLFLGDRNWQKSCSYNVGEIVCAGKTGAEFCLFRTVTLYLCFFQLVLFYLAHVLVRTRLSNILLVMVVPTAEEYYFRPT
jgi:hypothetical protein